VRGWTERYPLATDDVPTITEVAAWLAAHRPADGAPALIHNDFKFDNVILDPQLEAITGVLDWEMTTIGDPLMDLGTSLSYWVERRTAADAHDEVRPDQPPGMMTGARWSRCVEQSGARRRGRLLPVRPVQTAVVARIYYRFAKGPDLGSVTAVFIGVRAGQQAQRAIAAGFDLGREGSTGRRRCTPRSRTSGRRCRRGRWCRSSGR
jgi:aminoglycoside phosphotransferase (APT) family kinase protein